MRNLDYRGRDPDEPVGGLSRRAQIALGFGAYVAAVVVGGMGFGGSIWLSEVMHWEWGGPIGGILFALLCTSFMILCMEVSRRWRWEQFWVGVVLGLLLTAGVALLGVGLCFATFGVKL